MSFLIKIIELMLIFIIVKSFLQTLWTKQQKTKNFSKNPKKDIEKFDLKEQDIVDADYEEIK